MKTGVKFVGVGIASTVVYFGIVWLIMSYDGSELKLAHVLAYLSAMVVSYAGHRAFTFASQGAKTQEIGRFIACHAITIALSTSAIALVVDVLGMSARIGLVVACGVVLIASYLLMRFWVFHDRNAHRMT
ncbi:MAG: GtrA family protein [Hyphomicrobium sp.]